MRTKSGVFAIMCTLGVFACDVGWTTTGGLPNNDEVQEIVENLMQTGYSRDDITVVDGVVYVQQDAAVSLQASREMLEADVSRGTKEQYRTTNLVSYAVKTICIDDAMFNRITFNLALDRAIANYNSLGLNFVMRRTTANNTGCDATIKAFVSPDLGAGVEGLAFFPSNGLPYSRFDILETLSSGFSVDIVTRVITHELGHTLGLRHSDYFNRVSCNENKDEGADRGAILIPGTPSTATIGASLMNACRSSAETGNFFPDDVTAITALYQPLTRLQQIVWHNDSTLETEIWFMLDNQIRARATVTDESGNKLLIGSPWKIYATASRQIVWHNDSTDATEIWSLFGARLVSRSTVLGEDGRPLIIGRPWQIIGADEGEIIWHNSESGETQVWMMSGSKVLRRPSVVDESGNKMLITSPWKATDGNLKQIVWHNDVTNVTEVWNLSGGTQIVTRPSVTDEDGKVILIGRPWRIVGGPSAFLWYNDATFEAELWSMFGGIQIGVRRKVVEEEGNLIRIAPPWNIAGISEYRPL